MVKALHHFMFVKPSTLHYPCIIHRQNQCHKYRQNHPFPMIFSWGFIGNGRNVSICEQAKQQRWLAGQAGKVARQTELTGRAGSECRQHCGSQYFGRQYLSRDSITTSRRARQTQQAQQTRQTQQTRQSRQTRQTQQTSQPICRTHGQAQQTILQKRGRQLGVSWSSPAGGIRLPGTSPPTSSPTPTASTTPPTPPSLVQPRPTGTKHRQRTPAAPSLVGTDSC